MTHCAVSFGRDQTSLVTVGYRLYDGAGATTQARTTVGVLEFQNGAYGVDIADDALDAAEGIEWDTGAAVPIFAHQDLTILKAAIALTAALLFFWRRRRWQKESAQP
ncbi:MAG: hypothetical protein V3V10_06825 [Planctomycetota bacterium]